MEDQNKQNVQDQETLENEVEVVSEETNPQETTEQETKEEYTGKQATTYLCYDYKTLKAFTMYNTVVKRKGVIKYLVLGIISLLLSGFVIVNAIIEKQNATEEINITSRLILGGICVLFAIYIIIQSFKFEEQVDKAILRHFGGKKEYNEQNIIVREDKVIIIPLSHPNDKYEYEWYQITNIEEIPGYIVLFSGKMPIIVEMDASKVVNGTYEDLMDIIKEKIQTKPFKKYEKQLYKKPIPQEFVHKATPKYYQDIQVTEEPKDNQDNSEEQKEDNNENN